MDFYQKTITFSKVLPHFQIRDRFFPYDFWRGTEFYLPRHYSYFFVMTKVIIMVKVMYTIMIMVTMMMTFILTEFRFTEPLLQVYCPSESSVCNGLACFPARGQLAGNGSSFSTFKPTTTI